MNERDTLACLEIARAALADADLFDDMALTLDLSDDEMSDLRDRLEDYLGIID